MLEPKKTAIKPSDIRSISDPPDMGKIWPADAVAGAMVLAPEQNSVGGWRFELAVPRRGGRKVELVVDGYGRRSAAEDDAEALKDALADLIQQWRAEGAAEALDGAATDLAVGGYESIADGLREAARARIRPISDPPDPG
jgi:hypothetical protein